MQESFFIQETKQNDILIIENFPTISSLYEQVFIKLFKSVDRSNDPIEILEKIQNNNINIVFIDLQASKLDSFRLLKEIREIDPSVYIIAYSPLENRYIFKKCIQYRVSGFLTIHCNEIDLKDILNEIIKEIYFVKHKKPFNPEITLNNCLTFLQNSSDCLKIVSHFKGIPIIRNAIIKHFDDDQIVLTVDKHQLATLKIFDHIVISSLYMCKELYCKIQSINLNDSTITLRNARFIDTYLHHRKFPRIEPDMNFSIYIKRNNSFHKLDVLNVSATHALCKLNMNAERLSIHSNVVIRLNYIVRNSHNEFTNENFSITTNALVDNIFKTQDGVKILLHYQLEPMEYALLDRYIEKKVKETILELKQKLKFVK